MSIVRSHGRRSGGARDPYTLTGLGPFLHDHPKDRPVDVFGGRTTLHLGGKRESYVLLPIISCGLPSVTFHRATTGVSRS